MVKTTASLYENLRLVIENQPNDEALVIGETKDTFHQLGAKVDALAAGLNQLGIKKGDRIGIILPNSDDTIYTYFALSKIGAPFVPLNPQLRTAEIRYVLLDSGAVALITAGEIQGFNFLDMIGNIRADLPNLKHIISWGYREKEQTIPLASLYKENIKIHNLEPVGADDMACIIYTSGTSGFPKGVVMLNKTLTNRLDLKNKTHTYDYKDIRINAYPMFSGAGVAIPIEILLNGNKLVLMERFHPAEYLKLIERERVTGGGGAPAMLRQILRLMETGEYDVSSLRWIGSGGSKATPELVITAKKRFGLNYSNHYACTEAGNVSMLLPDDPIEAQIHTVGRPLKGVDVKITDGERRKLPVGKPGEIAVRSPGQMWGYFNDPEKTSAAFDDQNYYYTGDIGCMDENGYLRILDRKKDMIIRGAQNIYPSEIENYLNTHPKVHMSAVIGVPSKISDEIVRVYIQLEKGEDMSATEIVDFCRGQIAAYKIPQEVRFVDNLPLGGSMKVKKQDLREKALKELDLGNK